MRRGGRARLKASDSKSDRGPEGPSGVQILSPPPKSPPRGGAGGARRRRPPPAAGGEGGRGKGRPSKPVRRGDRAAEGAALEMPCTGNPCAVGSNPTLSAIWDIQRGRARRGGSGAL